MRWVLTAWFTLILAGCSSPPARNEKPQDRVIMPSHGLFGLGSSSPRLGVEHLPPGDGERKATLQVRSIHRDNVEIPDHLTERYRRQRKERQERPGWDLREAQIEAMENPVERFAMSFMCNLMGEDRRRVDRAIGTPILAQNVRHLNSQVPQNFYDERMQEDQEAVLREHGARLVERPLLNSLQELTPWTDVRIAIRPFNNEDPTTDTGRMSYGADPEVDYGELSLRIRPVNFNDPVDMSYTIRGFRVGSGQRRVKLGMDYDLMHNVRLSFRSEYNYRDQGVYLLGSLRYRLNDHTRAKLLVGNSIDLMTHPASYPGQPPEEERSQGFLFYVEHMF